MPPEIHEMSSEKRIVKDGGVRNTVEMNTISHPFSNQILVFQGGITTTNRLLEAAATLALSSSLYLLDGGNRANAYSLATTLRLRTPDPTEALKRIHIARAFTCYQMASLLEEVYNGKLPRWPVLVLDLLSTFYDESVPYSEAGLLLEQSIGFLQVLSRTVPVIISAHAPVGQFLKRRPFFLRLCEITGQVWEEFSPDQDGPFQLSLF